MATHFHRRARAAPGGLAPARPGLGTKLLTAAQWGLALLALISVAVVIATTPEAWPL